MLTNLIHDVRSAWRGLSRAKLFAGAAASTLALGIAGTTVMFALIQGVLLRPLPVHDQDRLVMAWKEPRASAAVRYPFGNREIESVARTSQLLEKVAGITRNGVGRSVVTDNGVPGYANVALVTGGFFDVLGVRPVLGRTLTSADERKGAENVIVLSSELWRRRFGGSRDVIGRHLIVDEQPFTVVGVMPPDLAYPTGVEVWRTTSSVPVDGPFGDAARDEVNLIARLRPGVTLAQATSEIAALSRRLEADAPATAVRGLVPVMRPFVDVVVGEVRAAMLALFAAVTLVLLVASANVANLVLMRGEGRSTELAVRAALGAGRGRLARLVVMESMILSVLAGASAVVASWWSLQALISVLPEGLPRLDSVHIDGSVLLFSFGVVCVTGLLAGLGPALLSTSGDLLPSLRTGGRGVTAAAATRGRRTLVVAQVALAVTIVAGAGVLIRSVLKLQAVDLGLPVDRLVMLELHLPQAIVAERRRHAQFLDEVMAELEAVPAIVSATPVNVPPFSGQGWDLPRFTAEGQSDEETTANPTLNLESVHPNYFETFEVPLRRGRAFSAADRDGMPDVAIISEDLADRTWAGENPIGKRLKMGRPGARGHWYTIVGVAAQTRYRDVASPRPTLYLPAAQFQMTATLLVLRTTESLDLISTLVPERISAVYAGVRVMRVASFDDMLARPVARPRFNAFLLGIFGTVALVLSAVGLYAVLAAFVGHRDRELAVRLALGASASRVRRLVLAEGLCLAGLGVVIGVAGALVATQLLHGLLFEIDPLDPLAITASVLLVIAVSAVASYLPARRATRIDAAEALRSS